MGRLLVIWRLVRRDLNRRPLQSLLLGLLIATTTTTLALGLALGHTNEGQFARTRVATAGPDFVAEFQPSRGVHSSPAPLRLLARSSEVAAAAGPFPVAFARLRVGTIDAPIQAVGRNTANGRIDRPILTSGRWAGPGSAVLEQGLAETLQLHLGEAISVGSQRLRVSGVAVTSAQAFYPARRPGMIWVTTATARSLATRSQPLGYLLELRLAKPAAASAFADSNAASSFLQRTLNGTAIMEPWEQIRSDDYKILSIDHAVLVAISSILAILAISGIAVIVGGRMAEQTRRVGLLKAVGATPLFVGLVLLAENLLIAIGATGVGIGLAAILEPVMANPGDGLIGSSATPPLTLSTIWLVAATAIGVACASTLIPAIRAARASTLGVLTEPAHAPKRRPGLVAFSARLPVPMLLGVRFMARRPRRSVLTATSLTIAVAMIVTALSTIHAVDLRDRATPTGLFIATGPGDQMAHLVLLLSGVLVALAALTATFTSWATAIDAQRTTALTRALGATPRQTTAGLVIAQTLPALAAAALGIPIGLLLYANTGHGSHTPTPPIGELIAVIPATLAAIALLTAIPAQALGQRPIAPVLRES